MSTQPNPLATSDEIVGGIPAYGTLIQVLSDPGPPEVYTTIEGVGDITGPGNSMDEIDVTSHSTGVPIKQVIPGLIDLGELAFPCYWIPSDPTQKMSSPYGLEYLFFTRKVTKFQLVNTDPTHRTRQFKGFVKSIAEDAKVTGVMQRNCSIRITSPWVDAAAPMSATPSTVSAPSAGTPSGTIAVKTGGSHAPWNPVPSVAWITITAPTAPQMGDGDITYTVAAQLPAAPARSGTIDITGLGLVVTIDQAIGT